MTVPDVPARLDEAAQAAADAFDSPPGQTVLQRAAMWRDVACSVLTASGWDPIETGTEAALGEAKETIRRLRAELDAAPQAPGPNSTGARLRRAFVLIDSLRDLGVQLTAELDSTRAALAAVLDMHDAGMATWTDDDWATIERARAEVGTTTTPKPDKQDECGCHPDCTTLPHQCERPCGWPACLTEAESAELVAAVDAELAGDVGVLGAALGQAEELIRLLRTEVAELRRLPTSRTRCGECLDAAASAAAVLGWDEDMIRAMAEELAGATADRGGRGRSGRGARR